MDWPDTQDIRYIISVSTGRHMPLSYDHDGAAEQSSLDDQLEAASDESERAIVNALNRLRKQRALKQVWLWMRHQHKWMNKKNTLKNADK